MTPDDNHCGPLPNATAAQRSALRSGADGSGHLRAFWPQHMCQFAHRMAQRHRQHVVGATWGPRKPTGAPRLQQVVSEDWGAQSPLKWTGSRRQYSEPCSGQLILMTWPPFKKDNKKPPRPAAKPPGVFLFVVRRLQSHSFFKQLYMLDGTSAQCWIEPSHMNFRSLTCHDCLVYSYIVHVCPHACQRLTTKLIPRPARERVKSPTYYGRTLGPGGGQRVMPSIIIASRSCHANFHL